VRARILIALALVGALAGCQESGFDESKETQRPLKVQDAMNPLTGTKVPGQAERPLTLSADTLGDTLALGVRPVGATAVPPYLRKRAHGIKVLAPDDPVEFEATDPDVILGTKDLQGGDYDVLSHIAPTILTEGDDWKLSLRLHGEALGRTNDAEKLLTDWDNRVARVKQALAERDVSVELSGGAKPGAVGKMVLDDLGIKRENGGQKVLRIHGGPEWSDGGLMAARTALEDIAKAL
jgi:iron complex transport system substrate-binding protein